jgi:hypothetical protein
VPRPLPTPRQLPGLRRVALLLALLTAAGVLLPGAAARAADPPLVPFSLTLAPTRLIVPATGRASTQIITLTNNGATMVPVTAVRYDFVQAPDGAIQFVPARQHSAAAWLTVTPSSFVLAPGHRQQIQVRIAIPPDPDPGEHQVGLVFSVPGGQSENNIAINRGVGTQLLISVPGPIVHRVALTGLKVPRFVDGRSAQLTATISNTGTVHRDYLGAAPLHAYIQGTQVTFPDFTVLRGSSRVISTRAQHLPLLCVCRVTVSSDDGTGRTIGLSRRLIVFPLRAAIGMLLLTIAVILLLRRSRIRRRRRTDEQLESTRQAGYEQARKELAANAE